MSCIPGKGKEQIAQSGSTAKRVAGNRYVLADIFGGRSTTLSVHDPVRLL